MLQDFVSFFVIGLLCCVMAAYADSLNDDHTPTYGATWQTSK